MQLSVTYQVVTMYIHCNIKHVNTMKPEINNISWRHCYTMYIHCNIKHVNTMKPEINNISWRHCYTDRTVQQSTGHCLHNSKNIIKVTLSIGCYGQHWFKSNLNSVLTDSKKNIISRESIMKVTQQNTGNIKPTVFSLWEWFTYTAAPVHCC